jgi:hypothetical protein
VLDTEGRKTKAVTGAAEAAEAMAAPAAGIKRTWDFPDDDESAKKTPERFQDLKALLKANWSGANASSATSTESTTVPSSESPATILGSPLGESIHEDEIPSGQADVDVELDEQFELLKKMGVPPFAATGSSETAFGSEIMGSPDALPTVTGSPEAAPTTPLSVAPAVPTSWTDQLRQAEVSLIEPEPTNVVGGIGLGIGTEDDAEMRRWAKLADDGFDLRCGPGQRFARDPEAKTGASKAMNIAQKAEFRK